MRIALVRDSLLSDKAAAAATVLARLDAGTILEATGERRGDWIRVVYAPPGADAITGWLAADDAQFLDDAPAPLGAKDLLALRRRAEVTVIGAVPAPVVADEEEADDGVAFPDDVFEQAVRKGGRFSIDTDAVRDRRDDGDFGPASIGRPEKASRRAETVRRRPPARRTAKAPAKRGGDRRKTDADVVDVSVFAPPAIGAGRQCLVQAFLHGLDQAPMVAAAAREADASAARRGVKTLAADIARGARVRLVCEGNGLTVADPLQELTWRGTPDVGQFLLAAPADAAGTTFHPRILALVDGEPVGSLMFALPAIATAQATEVAIRGDTARHYRYAFLSYASQNRTEVLARAQVLKSLKVKFFQDILSLEPGERWEKGLYKAIDDCDVFLLFWSSHAKASPWVGKEVDYALARQTACGCPDIVPVIIEGPPPVSPPAAWKHIHFNDALAYVLAAAETEAKARAGSR